MTWLREVCSDMVAAQVKLQMLARIEQTQWRVMHAAPPLSAQARLSLWTMTASLGQARQTQVNELWRLALLIGSALAANDETAPPPAAA